MGITRIMGAIGACTDVAPITELRTIQCTGITSGNVELMAALFKQSLASRSWWFWGLGFRV